MPKKPIKHGIKVFAVCCTFTAVLLGFEVYLGSEDSMSDHSAIGVVERLVETAGLTKTRRLSYTQTTGTHPFHWLKSYLINIDGGFVGQ